ncbi:H+/Cl-antiporter ClcA [Snodgrassella sp. R-53583]|nr:H+/Cl-antiporter ClcA [Snodgrassella sp. R-53583]
MHSDMVRLSPKLIALLLLCGAIAGVAGMALIGLLHLIQQVVYGISRVDGITFRNIVEQTSATHRLLALSGCGVIAGTGWFLLHRYASKLVDIKQAISNNAPSIPLSTTMIHALLQILTVGMGSPLGRETAPREISSAIADYISRRLAISAEERKILLSCSAAAGLAAVFDVPLAGALFALETLLFSFQRNHVIAALICCTTAAWVARLGLGSIPAYQLPAFTLNSSLLIWALLFGPVIVASSWLLQRQLAYCKPANRSSPRLIFISMAAFILIGAMAMWLPEILGNGKAGNELLFNDSIGWRYALALLIGKWLALLLATRGGAYGGFITPSMMLGGLIALLAATAWNSVLPSVPVVAAVITGATVFLAIQQKMPLTAILFVLEITNIAPDFIMPVSLCLLTALPCQQALNKQ